MKVKETCADCGIELRYTGESHPGFDSNAAPDGFWCDDCLEKIEIKQAVEMGEFEYAESPW